MKTGTSKEDKVEEEREETAPAKETEASKPRGPWRSPLKKHVSSTFIPMISRYMSEEQLQTHVEKQLSIERDKYEEPVPERPTEEEKRKLERKRQRQLRKKKHAAHHGSILSSSVSDMSGDGEDDEKDLEKMKFREHARSRMLDDLHLLRNYYKMIYKKALSDKVTNQRKEQKEREQKAEKKEKRKQEREEKARHKVVIRLPRSEVMNDLSFKQKIPETGYHKIIRLEHQLKKEGYLFKIVEIKAFWDYLMVQENLQRVLDKGQFRWSDILEYEKKLKAGAQSPEPGTGSRTWAVTNVDRMLADDKPARNWRSTTHTRANLFSPSGLTDIASSRSGRESTPSSPSKLKSAKTSSSVVQSIEQKFPKVEFPPMAAYTLVFGEQEPNPEEIAKEMEVQRRLDSRRETRKQLITMFSHALANRAATQRLIEKNAEYSFDTFLGTTSVRDIMTQGTDSLRAKPPLFTAEALEEHDRIQLAIEQGQRSEDEPSEEEFETGTRSSTALSQNLGSDAERIEKQVTQQQRLPPIPAPLTMEVVTQRFPVQEAKGLSTLWVNPF